ncbi:rod shape-determining protein MreD [Priestia koreensis]|uniref:Rod shape-determining protein MreD n=1 Tax=Priestia koreensis TaxID=284581 RepID=A0A0M0L7D2_9BACI|nr:rod shape-determining protein MreD [Priestia koreensis]KOO46970.1 rod shape-determining protein MreD [Priestia koreensis]MCM3002644.1 rod shape-determining protein MreD [Priestia koreensis]UNL84348.1 rod shape-determining protein MreD [Priestia koreensis]
MNLTRLFLPILVSVVFILESLFTNFIAVLPSLQEWILSPRFLLIILVFMVSYINLKQGMIYGIIFGMLYDIAFTDVLGVYMFGFPVICFIMTKFLKILQNNIIVVSFISLLAVALLEFYVYSINLTVHLTHMGMTDFLHIRFYPTMILNAIFIIIFAFPMQKRFQKLSIEYME